MILDKDISDKTSELLLQINAIKLEPKNYFTWTSGIFSPIYCDNRMALSFPKVRDFLKKNISKIVFEKFPKVEVIAGVATGAISIGTLIADLMNLPFVYVRPEPKSHGRKNQIEGYLEENKNVVVIEDLISTGKSSLLAIDVLKQSKANVLGMVGIFSYGFDLAKENFKNKNIDVYTLGDYENLIQNALDKNYISVEDLEVLKKWRENPQIWNKQ